MRTVFFGTPDFAVPSLRALVGEGFEIVAVVTQPDRPVGRHHSTARPSPVKTAALEEGITILQPDRPRGDAFAQQLQQLEPELGVVVAYGHILERRLLGIPDHGMINVHASLLPAYRGAAPIQHAIMDGVDVTGVTIMQMDEGMDSGPILHQVDTPLPPDETFGELHTRLAELGALALVEALTMIQLGQAQPREQDPALVSFAPKITRDTARIDWGRPAEEVARLVRAMDPVPGAWTALGGRDIKLYGPQLIRGDGPAEPGEATVHPDSRTLVVATGSGPLGFLDVQPAGGRRMPSSEWLRGRPLPDGARFG